MQDVGNTTANICVRGQGQQGKEYDVSWLDYRLPHLRQNDFSVAAHKIVLLFSNLRLERPIDAAQVRSFYECLDALESLLELMLSTDIDSSRLTWHVLHSSQGKT
jgi:hypothetical protein